MFSLTFSRSVNNINDAVYYLAMHEKLLHCHIVANGNESNTEWLCRIVQLEKDEDYLNDLHHHHPPPIPTPKTDPYSMHSWHFDCCVSS